VDFINFDLYLGNFLKVFHCLNQLDLDVFVSFAVYKHSLVYFGVSHYFPDFPQFVGGFEFIE